MRRPIGTFSGALFDMDGTLIDSAGCGERAWRTLASRWGLAEPDPALFRAVHGMPARDSLSLLAGPERVEEACRELEEIEVADTEGVLALPGAAELLTRIHPRRYAIVTSSFARVVAARLAAAGLNGPQHLVSAESVVQGKPHPEPFLAAARLMGVPATRCVAFEDTLPGIRSARAAGCFVVAVAGLGTAAELAEADLVLASLTQVEASTGSHGVTLTAE